MLLLLHIMFLLTITIITLYFGFHFWYPLLADTEALDYGDKGIWYISPLAYKSEYVARQNHPLLIGFSE